MGSMIDRLLAASQAEPEKKQVKLPRLGVTFTLQELSYNDVIECRRSEDAALLYILKSAVDPNLRDPKWYRDAMGSPTPIEAMRKLLRAGEVERLCKVVDILNGYGAGSVAVMEMSDEQLEGETIEAALDDLEKN